MAKAKKKTIRTIPQQRTAVREQDPKERVKNFAEVNCGYTLDRRKTRPNAACCVRIQLASPAARSASTFPDSSQR